MPVHQRLSMMKPSSALPITSPKNIPISRKQHLRNHCPFVASWHFCLSRRARRQPRRLKSKISDLCAILVRFEQLPWVCFFFNFPQTTTQKSVAEMLLHGLPETTFQNPPTPLKLACCCVTRSPKLYLWVKCGHNRTLFSPSLVSSSFVYPHLSSISLPSCPTAT